MKQDQQRPTASPPANLKSFFRRHAFPNRDNLHSSLRLAFGGVANLVLILWVIPHLGNVRDPGYSPINALRPSIEVLIPGVALLTMAPVFFLGRDVPRLLAIGLSFLPGYTAFVGIGATLSLWLGG